MVDVVSGTEERACKENIESWNRSFSVLFKLPALSEVELFVFKDKCPPSYFCHSLKLLSDALLNQRVPFSIYRVGTAVGIW